MHPPHRDGSRAAWACSRACGAAAFIFLGGGWRRFCAVSVGVHVSLECGKGTFRLFPRDILEIKL